MITNKQNLTKKLLIIDSKCGESFERVFKSIVKNKQLNLELKAIQNLIVNPIPRDYDLYLVHLSNVNEKDIKKLREEQPWSWIYAIYRKAMGHLPEDIGICFDGIYSFINEMEMEEILEKIQRYRS